MRSIHSTRRLLACPLSAWAAPERGRASRFYLAPSSRAAASWLGFRDLIDKGSVGSYIQPSSISAVISRESRSPPVTLIVLMPNPGHACGRRPLPVVLTRHKLSDPVQREGTTK